MQPLGRWEQPEVKARALELWNDPANYTYSHIASIMNREWPGRGFSKGVMSKFFFDNGNKRAKNARADGPRKPVERKPDMRSQGVRNVVKAARERARAMKEAQKAKARVTPAFTPKADPIDNEPLHVGQWPRKAFKLSRWSKPTIGLENLDSDLCKWPFECDDGHHVYCGAKATILVYCLYHGNRAYRQAPSEDRNATGGRGGFEDTRTAYQGDAQGRDDEGDDGTESEYDPGRAGAQANCPDHDAEVQPAPREGLEEFGPITSTTGV